MVSRVISKLPVVGAEPKIVLDGSCSHSLYVPTFGAKLISFGAGVLVSESRILSRTALSLKCSSMVQEL